MKAQRIEVEDGMFKPFAIQLKVESVQEAQALYALFNFGKNTSLLNNCEAVKAVITDKYYISDPEEVIANGITYEEYYLGNAYNLVIS